MTKEEDLILQFTFHTASLPNNPSQSHHGLYYRQRATDGGLIIAEATNTSPAARGYFGGGPGLFNQDQVDGRKLVTKAVRDKGGKFIVQLWHAGRVSHPLNQPNGELPVSSSATSVEGIHTHAITREGRQGHVIPRAVDIDEIPTIVADFKHAAENAIAANGYLLEQFLCDSVNKRTDKYGGSIEIRARIIFEVVEAILSSLPSSQVGIRLSPFGNTFDCNDSTPHETYSYMVDKLNDYDLAYIHLVERRGMHAPNVDVPEIGVARYFRDAYKGVLITASGYDREDGIKTVEEGTADLVAFGRDFVATPDLVERLRTGAELNSLNKETLYPQPGVPLEAGYTDYPFLSQKA